jgi:protocatechuate 3,4-dioxygenase beta subunit
MSRRSQSLFQVAIQTALLLFVFSISVGIGRPVMPVQAAGAITGNVFRDFNLNGIDDGVNEIGVAGVSIRAYDAANVLQGTAISDTNGNYTLNTSGTGPYRIEFSNLPTGYFSGPQGAGSGSTVQFAPEGGASGINLGINHPEDFTPTDIDSIPLVASMWIGGGPSNDPGRSNQGSTLRFTRDMAIEHDYDGGYAPMPHARGTSIATVIQTGGTGSSAYDQSNKLIYLGAFAHRGVDYGPGADGILGTSDDAGAIYIVDDTNPVLTGNLPALNLPNAGPASPTPRGINGREFGPTGSRAGQTCLTIASSPNRPTSPINWALDSCSYDMAGKEGVGGIVIDQETQILYAVNLYDRHLYSFDISSGVAATIQSTLRDIGPLTGGSYPSCVNGEWRPFALKQYRDELYLGGICSAEDTDPPMSLATANSFLSAHVYRLNDPNSDSSAVEVYTQSLSYPRQLGAFHGTPSIWLPWIDSFDNWQTWAVDSSSDSVHGSPMLVDLTFDRNGNLILGFADRMANQNLPLAPSVDQNGAYKLQYYNTNEDTQIAPIADGDLRRACWVPSTTGSQTLNGVTGDWHTENTASCPEGVTEFGMREFFVDDDSQEGFHTEMPHGFMAYLAGANELANSSMNPTSHPYSSGGVRFYNAGTGRAVQGFNLYVGEDRHTIPGLRAKGASMGDVEYLIDPAPIEVGNRVWHDHNRNGRQDPGEASLANVVVTLHDSTGTQIASAVTDANGLYRFSSGSGTTSSSAIYNISALQPNSDYTIRINESQASLNGLMPTTVDFNGAAGDLHDSDGDPSINLGSVTASLTTGPAGSNNHSYDFGFYSLSLGNLVWNDINNNGEVDGGETGIANVSVRLYLDNDNNGVPDGAAIATTTTNGTGHYLFTNLAEGTYIVEIVPPTDYISSTGTNGSAIGGFEPAPDPDDNSDNDDNGTTSGAVIRSAPVTLSAGTMPTGESPTLGIPDPTADNLSNLTVDFGLFRPLSLGNLVWNDSNNNGEVDSGEAGIAGVTVELRDGTGNTVIATTTTDANGNYRFNNLLPGDYIVSIPASQLASGASLEGMVSSTGTNGSAAGDYEPARDPDDDMDNDDNGTLQASGAVQSLPVTLSLNGEPDTSVDGDDNYGNQTVDFGFFIPASLGNYVWEDTTTNGIQEAGEPGVPNITVTLHDSNTNAVVVTTTTDANGYYLFENLAPGSYYLIFSDLPSGYDFVTPDMGGDNALDSDADPNTGRTGNYTLVAGQSDLTVDAGISQSNSLRLGNLIWADYNDNGLVDSGEPGIAGVVVELLDNTGTTVLATTTTDANGNYLFSALNPGDYIVRIPSSQFAAGAPLENWSSSAAGGSYEPASDPNITVDNDDKGTTQASGDVQSLPITLSLGGEPGIAVDGDDNNGNLTVDFGFVPQLASLGNYVWYDSIRNNTQDPSEAGVPGVTVRLLDSTGTEIANTTTDASGFYLFDNLLPGVYSVVFDISSLGPDYRFVNQDLGGDDALDSDANILTGATIQTTLTAGENDLTWDAGVYQLASLGDRVWEDTNENGVQDSGEQGVPNVVVQLYDGSGTLIASTTTDSTGFYQFVDLEPGDYSILVALPSDYRFTEQSSSNGSDSNDSDVDPQTGRSRSVTLAPGEHNPSLDAGIVKIAPTAIDLISFQAYWTPQGVRVEWSTASERDSFGFYIVRSIAGNQPAGERLNSQMILAQGRGLQGASYQWIDSSATAGQSYQYWLEEQQLDGQIRRYGPISISPTTSNSYHVYLPFVNR